MSQVIGQLDHSNGPVQLVVRANSKRIVLRLDHATRCAMLVLPHKRYQKQARKLLAERGQWLREQWQALPPPMPFSNGAHVLLGGELVCLRFEQGRGSAKQIGTDLVIPATQKEAFAGRVRRAFIAMARSDLSKRVQRHAQNLGVQTARITVRDTRSRWGSCSAAGNLNFSWRLICAPAFVLDYVAAHEVAHIREANHGPAFWQCVEQTYGSPRDARQYLADHGPDLFAVGAEV